ncbi:MAG: (d)CMP kinase [Magnetospirillum sp.]
MSVIIAIDGPAAAGKGTLARRVAAELGFDYLDTGLIYRAVGMNVERAGFDPADPARAGEAARDLQPEDLQADDLRGDEAAQAASKVAAVPEVRAALLDFQRRFATQPPGGKGAVLDGRDIGTVVCPQAGIKLYVTASAETRAKRRLLELQGKGVDTSFDKVLTEMRERDERDSQRAVAPLKPAEDAHILDTSEMDAEGAFDAAIAFIRAKL